ncbi:hypothetical protein WA026_010007 [Henosepilachna vigintioctopunctata]|uniref:Small ribosomal subunit protein mS39 n=1 Tax=Henosepilachna vigintioctopunctata TaxID=420089 RepID=A0AAW1TV59_9CUCU
MSINLLLFHARFYHLSKQISPKVIHKCLLTNYQIRLRSSSKSEEIIIPRKIPRGPTDILRALESTISRDPTAAHYKYHDDPYLTPKSNLSKRSLAMAQEAGKKAAHWVRKENVDLFQHREADPFIEKFAPPKIYTKDSEVTIDDLKYCVKVANISDTILVYTLLKEKSINIPPEIMQDILELLCFYNSEDPLSEEFIEERWFKQSSKGDKKQRKTWKDGAFAEEIFISVKEPTSETYSAIIRGMLKYYQVDRATQLFEEAKQKGFILNVETYNAILEAGTLLKENNDMRWSYIISILTEMNDKKLKPNLGTLNSILYCLKSMANKFSKEYALKVLSEFEGLGIQPSLATWTFVLQIFCRERGPISTILYDILNKIENEKHTMRDIRDVSFFVTAMAMCRFHLNDYGLAKRLDKHLHIGNNYDLIGDSYKESIYYRNFLILAVNSEPIHDFMENLYNQIVPNIYTPEMGVLEEIIKQVEISGAIEFLPKLWSDVVTFDCARKDTMLKLILDIMVHNEPENDPNLVEKFANIGSDIYEKLMNQNENRTNNIPVTGDMLGSIMLLLLRNNSFDKAWNLFMTLDKDHQIIIGVPKVEAISALIDACIEEKQASKSIMCIQYCADAGYDEIDKLAKNIQLKLTLDETHLDKLSKIIGQHVIISEAQKN